MSQQLRVCVKCMNLSLIYVGMYSQIWDLRALTASFLFPLLCKSAVSPCPPFRQNRVKCIVWIKLLFFTQEGAFFPRNNNVVSQKNALFEDVGHH